MKTSKPLAVCALAATLLSVTACDDYDCDEKDRVIARCVDGSQETGYAFILKDEKCPQAFGYPPAGDGFWSVGGRVVRHEPTGRRVVSRFSVGQEAPANVTVVTEKGRVLRAPSSPTPCDPPNKPGRHQ